MLTAKEIRELHDKGYAHGQTTREKAADDLIFYWISQWDSQFLSGSGLQYRGQFDVLRKAGRQIISDIKANPIQVDFEPVDNTDQDVSDIIDGMYRSDMRNNQANEAKENATTETIVCGVGAWELFHDYKSNKRGASNQVISRRPLYEANNQVFWDPNAKAQDKADADWVSCLVGYSRDGYKKLIFDETGEEVDDVEGSFAFPEQSYVFPWIEGDNTFYVTRFYFKEEIAVKVQVLVDMLGSEQILEEDDDGIEEFIDNGFSIVDTFEKTKSVIHLYIVGGGDEVISHSIIAGEHIPIVPMYGERSFVEGEEHYEGITRLAKDPQRLRNFQLSYLADIVSQSPRQKPIYLNEQIQGFEHMYEENGADNDYPYLLQNRYDPNGVELPLGAIAVTPEQPMPQALIASIALSKEAIDDVASVNLPKDIQDMDLSGEALIQLQKMFDKQSFIYQHNLKTALRRDGEVYASMAAEIYDTEREVSVVRPDNTKTAETINKQEVDPQSLELVVKNDIKGAVFDVYADIGQSYNTVKEQNRKELKEMINSEPPDSPMRQIMLLEYTTMLDGNTFKDMRKYARNQLILQGIKEPETDEEKQMLQQAQEAQANQQDPNQVMIEAEAQARMMEGQAAIQNEQNDAIKNDIEMFKAQTDRMNTQVKAQEVGANINYKHAQTQGTNIDNVQKVTQNRLRQSAQ